MGITAGVVCVTKFCDGNNKAFTNYIKYMERDEATKIKGRSKYNLFEDYLDYVGDTEKMGSLFTKTKDNLTKDESKEIKKLFKLAQKNNSNLWQTVISFDNDYLKKVGVLTEDNILNDKALKTASKKSIKAMLEKEGLQNAVWTASFHYNTDNIHIHIATVEPKPMREKIKYRVWKMQEGGLNDGKYVYQKNFKTGKMEKVPILDENGNQIILEGYKGKFKESSMHGNGGLRSVLVSELESNKEEIKEITSILRDIVNEKKNEKLLEIESFEKPMNELYECLKEMQKGKRFYRNMWNYNRNIMKPLQPFIDEISKKYIETYKKEEFEEFLEKIAIKEQGFAESYGGKNTYAENLLKKELYSRLGNAILKELQSYDKMIGNQYKAIKDIKNDLEKGDIEKGLSKLESEHFEDNVRATSYLGTFYASEKYNNLNYELSYKYLKEAVEKGDSFAKKQLPYVSMKYAKELLNSDIEEKRAYGIDILKEQDENGNLYATRNLAFTYFLEKYGVQDYEKALTIFEKCDEFEDKESFIEVCKYQASSKSFESDIRDDKVNYEALNKSEELAGNDNPYATNKLGTIYYKYGNKQEIDKSYIDSIEMFEKTLNLEYSKGTADTKDIAENMIFSIQNKFDSNISKPNNKGFRPPKHHFQNMIRYMILSMNNSYDEAINDFEHEQLEYEINNRGYIDLDSEIDI